MVEHVLQGLLVFWHLNFLQFFLLVGQILKSVRLIKQLVANRIYRVGFCQLCFIQFFWRTNNGTNN